MASDDPAPAASAAMGPRRGLRARLRLVALFVACAFLVLAFVRASERQAAEQQRIGALARDNAVAARLAFDATVREARTLLQVLAFGVARLSTQTRDPAFRALAAQTSLSYASLFAIDSAGALMAVAHDSSAAIFPATCLTEAARRRRFTVCEPYKRDRTQPGPWILTFLQPTRNADAELRFAGASITVDSLEAVRLASRLPTGSVLTMFDTLGLVVLRTRDADAWMGRQYPDWRGDRGPVPTPGDTVINSMIDRAPRLFGVTSSTETAWRIYVGIPVDEAFASSRRQFALDVLIGIGVSLGMLLLGYWMSARIVGPIESLTRDAEAISRGDMARRSQIGGDDEVATLARTFNQMADAIVERTTALATSQEQLRQAQKLEALGGFAGGVAHEFNNYLSSIIGHAELALAQSRGDPAVGAELGGILTSATRAANLTRQVLVFSRRQVVAAQVIDVAPAIHESARLLERLLGERITLRVHVADAVGPVLIDPGQLEQVLMNLAANARDAMPHGGTVSIDVDRAPDGERARLGLPAGTYVRVTVSDTGPGVPEPVRARLFEPFFTTKARDHGTGLGLSISYGILQSAGGAIELDTAATGDDGATFRFYLPEQRPSAPDAHAAASTALPRGGTERLLVVEDDASVAEVARRLLTRAGYEVQVLRDAESAIMALDGASYDLLLSDVVMPGMSGAALAQEARKRHPGLRVLLMSGYPDDDLVAHELARQEVSFLAKPFSQVSLLAAVRALLDEA
jgi:signal transduction histidine kinase/BarA-like signal transduction histidine kinase